MLQNATIERMEPAGRPAVRVSVRCALTMPTHRDLRWLTTAGVSATAMIYLPLEPGRTPGMHAGDRLTVRPDVGPAGEWVAQAVVARVGEAIRYVQAAVIPATPLTSAQATAP